MKQAPLVVNNIQHLLKQEPLEESDEAEPAGIHMSLGIVSGSSFMPDRQSSRNSHSHHHYTQTKNVVFRNPALGSSEPVTKHRDDG